MQGLELAKRYYEEVGRPMLERDFPELLPRLAAGLVGEGSECLGFDDAISQDHDFGAGFCLWFVEGFISCHSLTFHRYGKERDSIARKPLPLKNPLSVAGLRRIRKSVAAAAGC